MGGGQRTREAAGRTEVDCLEPIRDLGSGASVTVTVGYGFSFGAGKCSCAIHLSCDPTEQAIERARDKATELARQYALDGMKLVAVDLQGGVTDVENYRRD